MVWILRIVFFYNVDNSWTFEIKKAITVAYPATLLKKLKSSTKLLGLDLSLLDIELGEWIGNKTRQFIERYQLKIDLIASHGHTVFHQPENGLTLQIGNGQRIFNICGVTVVNDFRSKDVSLGGNGAPLTPIGDQLFFSKYKGCLNLGGIANISYEKNQMRIAYDIVAVNIVFNFLARQFGKPFDDRGDIARQGTVDKVLLNKLNALSFYKRKPPKSLGYEWVESSILPLLESFKIATNNKLATFVEHVVIQLVQHLPIGKTLISGGGVYHDFLIERLRQSSNAGQLLVIPDRTIVEFKEAMLFAFLGVLRLRGEVNCLRSATGASKDNCGGVVYYE